MKKSIFPSQGMQKAIAVMALFFTLCLQTKAFATVTASGSEAAANVLTASTPETTTDSLAAGLRGCAGTAGLAAYPLGCYVYFSDISSVTSGTACVFTIDFGDGTTETGTNPWFTHSYAQSGTYTITYVIQICAENGSTCSDDVTISVYVPCFD
ncbi:MAG: PKD domain-containing protein [Bacteroidetes bacterium]|nr:PKD domain-containing protein [Bacteroidota bacterium]